MFAARIAFLLVFYCVLLLRHRIAAQCARWFDTPLGMGGNAVSLNVWAGELKFLQNIHIFPHSVFSYRILCFVIVPKCGTASFCLFAQVLVSQDCHCCLGENNSKLSLSVQKISYPEKSHIRSFSVSSLAFPIPFLGVQDIAEHATKCLGSYCPPRRRRIYHS